MKNLFFISCLLLGFGVIAQPDQENIGKVTVTVSGRYEANVKEATKYSGQPNFQDSTQNKIDVKYDVPVRPITLKFEPKPIPPLRIKGARLQRLPQNYVKAGFGLYVTPEIEAYFGNSRNRDFQWSTSFKHLSTQNGVPDIYYDKNTMAENALLFEGKKVFKDKRLTFRVGGDYNAVRYYGMPDLTGIDSLVSSDLVMQNYKHAQVKVGFAQRRYESKKAFRDVNLSYHIMGDNFSTQEHDLDFDTKWRLKVQEQELFINLYSQYQTTGSDSSEGNKSLLLVGIRPHIATSLGIFNFDFGINVAGYGGPDTTFVETADKGNVFFAPHVKVSAELVKNILTFDAGWVGDVKNYGVWDLSQNNPFILPYPEVATSGENHIYAQLKGVLAKNLGFKVGASYKITDNRPLFYRDPSLPSNDGLYGFNVVYDDVQTLEVSGALEYTFKKSFDGMLYGNYWAYNTSEQEHAWHLPTAQAGINLKYNWKEKIAVVTDWRWVSKRWAHSGDETLFAQELDAYLDARLGLEYFYNQNLTSYINLTNLLSQDYQEWAGYPTQKIRFILGFTYKF